MSELNNVHSISKSTDELEQGKFSVDYIMDENKKCVGISHPDWPFTIMRNQHNKSETAIVCNNTDEPFGILDSDVFNTILMSWLLIDDPNLIDEAKIDDEWISADDRLPDKSPIDTYEEFNCYCNNGTDKIVTTLEWREPGFYDQKDNYYDKYVTHWKPLPEPPK